MTCSRCNGRLFRERTEDGDELVCLAGHRFSAVPLKPLDIPEHTLPGSRGPKSGVVKL